MKKFDNFSLDDIYDEIAGIDKVAIKIEKEKQEYINEAIKRIKNGKRSKSIFKDFLLYNYGNNSEVVKNFNTILDKVKKHLGEPIIVIERTVKRTSFSDPPSGDDTSTFVTVIRIGKLNSKSLIFNINKTPVNQSYGFPTNSYYEYKDSEYSKKTGNIYNSWEHDLGRRLNSKKTVKTGSRLNEKKILEVIIGNNETEEWLNENLNIKEDIKQILKKL